ncbi:MAG: tetratricopeptide repeat protein [Microbacterium sp.]|uniref:tetratricopeptide repeat protein n=1 Tax=Microbacterium sp. TaxID=51671 RepID=UPI003BAF1630
MKSWDERIDEVWADQSLSDRQRVEQIDVLADQRPDGDARALFERAGARDSAGLEAEAEGLYRRALDAGLDDEHRPQAVIQLASTLRNLGRTEEALEMLRSERERGGPLADAAAAFHALALASHGDPVAAVAVALETLAPHLPLYTRSVMAYARELAAPPR